MHQSMPLIPCFMGRLLICFIYFLDGFWPNWVPKIGGTYHSTPIFNFADACIFCGVVSILIFQKSFLEMKPLENADIEKLMDSESDENEIKNNN